MVQIGNGYLAKSILPGCRQESTRDAKMRGQKSNKILAQFQNSFPQNTY
jgi:hypothetical protein